MPLRIVSRDFNADVAESMEIGPFERLVLDEHRLVGDGRPVAILVAERYDWLLVAAQKTTSDIVIVNVDARAGVDVDADHFPNLFVQGTSFVQLTRNALRAGHPGEDGREIADYDPDMGWRDHAHRVLGSIAFRARP